MKTLAAQIGMRDMHNVFSSAAFSPQPTSAPSRARQRMGGVFLSPREQAGIAIERQLGTSVFGGELPVGFAVAFQKMVGSNCSGPTEFG
jgi:hypothetical protein